MDLSTVLFYFLATMICVSALAVVLNPSPVYSALALVVSMIGLSFLFFSLQAYFIAGVQLVVYAGAVMVLFVMVLMLFDLKSERSIFEDLSFFKKASTVVFFGVFGGLLLGIVSRVGRMSELFNVGAQTGDSGEQVKELSLMLFDRYVFVFNVLGLMLLLVAVGVVAISRAKGGTHAKS